MALTPFCSKLIADVGISMGDEGKGRLVCELVKEINQNAAQSSRVGMVMKVNGGANSGHTAGGLKFNLLPCAVVNPEVPCLGIGSGVVADPLKFWWEIKPIERLGYKVFDRLLIDERTMVSDLSHRLLDLAWEYYRANVLNESARGSTGRGITPAFGDEVGQWLITYADFLGKKEDFAIKLKQRMDRALHTIYYVCRVDEKAWDGFFETLTKAETRANESSIKESIFSAEEFNFDRFKAPSPEYLDFEALIDIYWEAGTALAPIIGDVREAVLRNMAKGNFVIGEFGQSYWLDKRHGFSPNVTASHTYAPEFFQSAGVPAQPIHIIGASKAYDTKVGTHDFITQMNDTHPLAEKLKKLEFGATTGRQRMVGWFDAVEKGDTLRYGGFQDLIINKLDALTYSDSWQGGELLICVAYVAPDGTKYQQVPRDQALRRTLRPVFLQYPGWREDISNIRSFDALPINAKRYVAGMVKGILDVAYRDGHRPKTLPNLRYIGVGPELAQIIDDVPETVELIRTYLKFADE